jgi:hypothetical protein
VDCSELSVDTGRYSSLRLSVSCHDANHHIDDNPPAIGASVGTPGEKYVLVCARTSPARQRVARVPARESIVAQLRQQDTASDQIQYNKIVLFPFYRCRTEKSNALPLIFPTAHMAHYGASYKPCMMAIRKGRLSTSTCVRHVKKKTSSPRHSNSGPDGPIVPCRPLLHSNESPL